MQQLYRIVILEFEQRFIVELNKIDEKSSGSSDDGNEIVLDEKFLFAFQRKS